MKYSMISIAVALAMVSGCASTGGSKPAGVAAWQKPDEPTTCVRTSSGKDVVLTGSSISLQKMLS